MAFPMMGKHSFITHLLIYMCMKKIMTLLLLMTFSMGTVLAQEFNSEKAAERLEKMTERKVKELKLDDATAAWFQPLFAEYVQKMKDTREKYSCKKDKKAACTDAEIMKNLENQIKCQEELAGVKSTYLKKFKAKLNAKQLQVIFCEKGKFPGKHPMMGKPGMKHGKKHGMKPGKCDKAKKCDKPCDKKCDKAAKKCDKAAKKCDKPCDKAKKCDAPKCEKK